MNKSQLLGYTFFTGDSKRYIILECSPPHPGMIEVYGCLPGTLQPNLHGDHSPWEIDTLVNCFKQYPWTMDVFGFGLEYIYPLRPTAEQFYEMLRRSDALA
jgi:hypothetical protein